VATKRTDPIRPGEILLEEFMRPLGLTANGLARHLEVPPNRISSIVRGDRSITADTALRLSRYFETTPAFWLNLQMHYDLEVAKDALAGRLKRIGPIKAA
jgi:addiction module HigA family antidote